MLALRATLSLYLLTSIDWHIELSSEVDEGRDRGREGSLREASDMFCGDESHPAAHVPRPLQEENE